MREMLALRLDDARRWSGADGGGTPDSLQVSYVRLW